MPPGYHVNPVPKGNLVITKIRRWYQVYNMQHLLQDTVPGAWQRYIFQELVRAMCTVPGSCVEDAISGK